jgi:hypothetical protein
MNHNEIFPNRRDIIKYINIPFIQNPVSSLFPKENIITKSRNPSIKDNNTNFKFKSQGKANLRLALVPSKDMNVKTGIPLNILNAKIIDKTENKSSNKTLYKSYSTNEVFPIFNSYLLLFTKNKVDKIFSSHIKPLKVKSNVNKRSTISSSPDFKIKKITEKNIFSLDNPNKIPKIIMKKEFLKLKGTKLRKTLE